MTEIAQAYPLQWPAGWKRTPIDQRKRAQFKRITTEYGQYGAHKRQHELTINDGVQRIFQELRALGVEPGDVVISSDLRVRNDGLPISGQATSKIDQGVAVYWRVDKATRCMATDRYDRIADNLAALAATLEAMRAIERHGGATILDRAFTGFLALAAPAAQDLPHQVLGVDENATRQEIEYAYRRLAQQLHPDVGGSHEAMSRINTARDKMLGALAP